MSNSKYFDTHFMIDNEESKGGAEETKFLLLEDKIKLLEESVENLNGLNNELKATDVSHMKNQMNTVYTSFITMILSLLSIGVVFTIIYGFATSVMTSFMSLPHTTFIMVILLWIICTSLTILFTIILINFMLISLSRFILKNEVKIRWYEKTYIWYASLIIILIIALLVFGTIV